MKALQKLSYGLYVVTSKKDDKFNGQVVNTVFQVASSPPTLAVSINRNNLTWEYIKSSKVFTASVICQDAPISLIGKFGFKSGRDVAKFNDTHYMIGQTGAPIVLDYATAFMEVKVNQEIDVGSHTLFIGEVINADIISDKACMTYDYYRQVKGGVTPKAAPGYIEENQPEKEVAKMAKYRCTVCGYIYNPEDGDPDSGISPGTPFEKLPDNWICPICGADKSKFEKID